MFLLRILLILTFLSEIYSKNISQKNLLKDFTCVVVKDELDKNPEMQTIVLIELENNFPLNFNREILKCLPQNVAKIVLKPHIDFYRNKTFSLSKSSMVIYVADKIRKVSLIDCP